MVSRRFWCARIEQQWARRSILWLRGVRRAGKTSLAQSLDDVEYFGCELPRVRRAMEDPEAFLQGLRGKRVVLDEVHRLPNPSELLKIAAEHFPKKSNLLLFARAYPEATLLVTTPDARPAFTRTYSGIDVHFLTLDRLVARIG